jgi:hypothetical protein
MMKGTPKKGGSTSVLTDIALPAQETGSEFRLPFPVNHRVQTLSLSNLQPHNLYHVVPLLGGSFAAIGLDPLSQARQQA